MEQEPVVIERSFNAPIDKVWKAITDKNEMKKWYFDLDEFRAEKGFEFKFTGQNKAGDVNYTHLCKVTEVLEGKKLSYSWRYEGFPGNSIVTFELFPEGDKTRLKLTHEGLETFPQDNSDLAKKNFAEGWNYITGTSLKNYLEH
jgi:uncharacterized protein YndB with AHSA1/START domain